MPIATPQGTLDFKSVDKVTFVGASSNTVIDTTTGSLGVGVGVGGPTSNLHVVGHTRLEGDIDMLHTSNTASIKLNSNVVTEFPRSKKLIKYPRVNLTQNALNNGYAAAASSENTGATRYAFKAFNSNLIDEWQMSGVNNDPNEGYNITSPFDANSNSPTISVVNGGSYTGAWIKIQLPDAIRVLKVRMYLEYALSSRRPDKAVLLGSNDDTNWYDLSNEFVIAFDSSGWANVDVNSPVAYYKHIKLLVTSLASEIGVTTGQLQLRELEYYGTPEYDPDAHGTDVVVKSLPNVPNMDWLEVYYDGQDYTTMPATVTDKSGNNRTGTPSGGVGFDTENKAFTFDGVDDYVTSTTLSSHFAGDPTVTYACWVKFNAMTTGQMFLTINAPGVYGQGVIGGLYLGTDGTIYNTVGNRGIQASEKLVTNRWYHLVATKIPGNTGTDTQKLYIDGVYVSQFPWNTSGNQVIGSNPVLRIGAAGNGNDRLNGYMANTRLFNRALTSDEVWQLYAYQKEYFRHGDLGMTLKAGRLGIGTSEPRAALDVRGNMHANGGQSWPIPCAIFSNVTPSNTGSTWFENNIGTIDVNYNKISLEDPSGTIQASVGSPYITLNRVGMYEFHTESSLKLQSGAGSSHIGHEILSAGVSGSGSDFGSDGYELITTTYNTVKLVNRTSKVLVTNAPYVVRYQLQPIANYTDRFIEMAYGSNSEIHSVAVKYLG